MLFDNNRPRCVLWKQHLKFRLKHTDVAIGFEKWKPRKVGVGFEFEIRTIAQVFLQRGGWNILLGQLYNVDGLFSFMLIEKNKKLDCLIDGRLKRFGVD